MPTLTRISGTEGSFFATGWTAYVESWAADSNLDLHDVTSFSSGGFREYVSGLKSLIGTCAGYLESDGAGGGDPKLAFTATSEATGIAGVLTLRGNCKITGTFLFSRKTVATGVNQAALFSAAFRATGTYTAAWAS